MKNLIHEIHRRSLWQVLGIYLAASWIALQVVETLSESMSLPSWVQGFSVILLVLGLPIVLATAFVQEGVGRRGSTASVGAGDGAETTATPDGALTGEDETGATAPPEPRTSPTVPAPRGRGVFTWKRAMLGGAGAFALLAVALGGWVAFRSLGIGSAGTLVAKGLLEERATILLTDFKAEDASLSRAATEAIRVDLSQSSVIDIADPGFVAAALRRMEHDPDGGLDAATGRELAQREGMPALITGEITAAGTGYVLTAQILTAPGGEVLVSDRETAGDDSEIVSAIDRLSRKLRERVGESLGDLAATPRLERVTTADLEALRTYSRAVVFSDQGQNQRAADLLEEAVAMDTAFAMAWRKLGMLNVSGGGSLGDFSRGVEALGRAYDFRDRLTERERLLAVAGYYGYVDKEPRREADAYERMLENDPEDTWALNNLALVLAWDLGDVGRAEDLLVQVLAIEDSTTSTPHWNLSVLLGAVGRYDESAEILDSWRRHVPGDPRPYLFGSGLAAAQRDYETADSLAREALTIRTGDAGDAGFSLSLRAVTAAARGREAEAARLMKEYEDIQPGTGNKMVGALTLASFALESRDDPREAATRLDSALARYPLEQMGPLDPPWGWLVELEARTRSVMAARELLGRWEAADRNAVGRPDHDIALAWIEMAEGRPGDAVRRLDGITDPACKLCSPRARAEAWRLSGPVDSAMVYAERFLAEPDMFRVYVDASSLGPALERLAGLYEETGALAEAASYYAQFVELWADADEEFQPRVEAAQARLEEILREIG